MVKVTLYLVASKPNLRAKSLMLKSFTAFQPWSHLCMPDKASILIIAWDTCDPRRSCQKGKSGLTLCFILIHLARAFHLFSLLVHIGKGCFFSSRVAFHTCCDNDKTMKPDKIWFGYLFRQKRSSPCTLSTNKLSAQKLYDKGDS